MATGTTVNIASHLPAMASLKPSTMAVVKTDGSDRKGRARYVHYTLRELNEKSDLLAWGLESHGITRGTRTVLMVTPGLDFFALTFALFKIGAIPVMIDPGIGVKNLGPCIAESEPRVFIGIPKAQVARLLLGWGRKTVKKVITVAENSSCLPGLELKSVEKAGELSGKGSPYTMAETLPGDMAAILFTSGSTGISKGAVYTHDIFDHQVRFIRAIYGIEPGEMDCSTFPLFALFGPALGMTSVIPDMDASRPASADPRKLIQAITDFGATNMFASPALINKLGRYGQEHHIRLPSLRRVISAGAPASPEALKSFSAMLSPGVEIFTPYGATEALPVCNIGSREILEETGTLTKEGRGACVGLPVPGMTVEIIKITDTPVAEWSDDLCLKAGETGEIVVKGPIVTAEYYNRKESTALAKVACPGGDTFYHRMGDVGYRDEKGRLWFCGRKTHRVESTEGALFTIPCEAVFNNHPKVFRTALVGVKKGEKTEPVIGVEPEKGTSPSEYGKIEEELRALGALKPHTAGIKTFLFHPSFPVDVRHNAKIFREKLALWAERNIS
jgi:olefin beta-lactone synthetase